MLTQGTSPLLVSMPHIGTAIPSELRSAFVPRALAVEDTDWHLDRLYHWLIPQGASVLRARWSRYAIDLNRPPDDTPMYPGASNTELCPTRFFTGDPLYRPGYEPSPEEKAKRRKTYWDPYHNALKEEIQRLKAIHGFVLLWDAHSIRSQIPWLFEGILPGLNIGTADGTSADSTITMAVSEVAASHAGATFAINGRFKGGYITRHYGNPAADVHAVQLEMCQSLYMGEEPPFEYSPFLAASIQPVLEKMVSSALSSCKALYAR